MPGPPSVRDAAVGSPCARSRSALSGFEIFVAGKSCREHVYNVVLNAGIGVFIYCDVLFRKKSMIVGKDTFSSFAILLSFLGIYCFVPFSYLLIAHGYSRGYGLPPCCDINRRFLRFRCSLLRRPRILCVALR